MSDNKNTADLLELRAAGENILENLNQALTELKKAKKWGIFDIFGGGFFTSYIKQNRMNEARACMRQAKYDLEQLGKEFKNVSRINANILQTNDFAAFSDLCSDNVWADSYVQERINYAIEQVEETIERIKELIY